MPKITYKDIYTQVVEEIRKYGEFANVDSFGRPVSNSSSPLAFTSAASLADVGTSNLITIINNLLEEVIPSTILEGLEVTATDPVTNTVNISAGKGAVAGRVYELLEDTSIEIPINEATTGVLYLQLFGNRILFSPNEIRNRLTVAKLIIPDPGLTAFIYDRKVDRDSELDGYIMNFKEFKLYLDPFGHLEEETLQQLRDVIGEVLADNLIGNIRLSENLKVTNSQGTVEINSDSIKIYDFGGDLLSTHTGEGIFFYDENQLETARFTADDSRIGNIRITPNTIQSDNYVFNETGFIIYDYGDAEFNNVRLRGTLFTSTIAENIFVNPGIEFIGDLIFDGNVCLKADNHLVFDCDLGEDTYITYNSTTEYFEFWSDGSLRLEL